MPEQNPAADRSVQSRTRETHSVDMAAFKQDPRAAHDAAEGAKFLVVTSNGTPALVVDLRSPDEIAEP